MSARSDLLDSVAAQILKFRDMRVVRVGIDGVDGAGKTTFADELAKSLRSRGGQVIRASIDSFHNPRAVRYRLGRGSPEGFFADSYDYEGLKKALLEPVGPLGSGRFRTAVFDHFSDRRVDAPEQTAHAGSILVFDGIFLHRPEIIRYWDFSVFLKVGFDTSIPRGAQRGPGFGSPDPNAPENHRYIEGQRIYLRTCKPEEFASLVIDNNDLDQPSIVRRNEITFNGLAEADLSLLRRWLSEPHVAEFWPAPEGEAELRTEFFKELPESGGVAKIIRWGGNPIGFIQHYEAAKAGGGWWPNAVEGTFGIDQFIGEPDFIDKGLGTQIIKKYVEILFQNPKVKEVIVDPDPKNLRAIRVYEKVGFSKVGQIITPDGDAMLLRIERTSLTQS